MGRMIISTTLEGAVTTVHLDGEMTYQDSRKFEALLRELAYHGKRQILLNLEKCRFIDSKSMFILLKYQRELLAGGGVIKLYKPNRAIRHFLTATNVDDLFDVFTDKTDAQKAFRRAPSTPNHTSTEQSHEKRRKLLRRSTLDQRCAIGMLVATLQIRKALDSLEAENVLDSLIRNAPVGANPSQAGSNIRKA